MLKEIAISDAYGAGFEFSTKEKIAMHNNLSNYVSHDLYKTVGKYTDDTQMSIAISELILSNKKWSDLDVASKFVECFKRDPRTGYSKGFFSVLNEVNDGNQLLLKIRNSSERNGAAMRSMPLGFIKSKSELLAKAKMQAAITHNTTMGIKSSCAVALTAHFGLHCKGEINKIKNFLEKNYFSGWQYEWQGQVSINAFDTVSAALHCLINCRDLKTLLIKCVSLGGDTDSVSSIAIGLATCFDEYENNLPNNLIESLDEKNFGMEYLDCLDRKLHDYAF